MSQHTPASHHILCEQAEAGPATVKQDFFSTQYSANHEQCPTCTALPVLLCLFSAAARQPGCAAGVFVFFGIWHFAALVFVLFLLPETRGIPLEHVSVQHDHTIQRAPAHVTLSRTYLVTAFHKRTLYKVPALSPKLLLPLV